MNNDEAYAQGLLARALDPSTQPPAIRAFLAEELSIVGSLLPDRAGLVDIGCGAGRHLIALRERLARGIGLDYDRNSIAEAASLAADFPNLSFFVADATAVPLAGTFEMAVCLTNTWGTIPGKARVLEEMRRLSPAADSRLLTVYADTSIPARREWYENMGHPVRRATESEIVAAGGFTSEHFTDRRIREHLGACELHRVGDIAFVAQF